MSNILKNWRTSLAGVLSIGSGLAMIGNALINNHQVDWQGAGSLIVIGIGLIKAADAATTK